MSGLEWSEEAGDDRSAGEPAEVRRPGAVTAVLRLVEMERWAERLGPEAVDWAGLVALYGPLGSGKSTLVRAAARAVGVEGPIQSPTYTLVHEHPLPGGGTLFHVDLYRIEEPAELPDLGWERLLLAPGPVFVEWADRAEGWLPTDRWEIRLEMVSDPTCRRATVRGLGGAPPPTPPRREEAG